MERLRCRLVLPVWLAAIVLLALPVGSHAENDVAVALPRADAFQELATDVNRFIEDGGCTAGVVIRDLRRGDAIYLNKDVVFPAASLIKVPIMVTVFNQIDDGRLALTDTVTLRDADKVAGSGILKYCPAGSVWSVEELVTLMIAKSDNTASDLLLAMTGMAEVNAQMRELGLTVTRIRRAILDFAAIHRGVENTTSAYEMMRLLEMIYRGEAASRSSCRAMLNVMLQQEYNDRITRNFPADLRVAHKTGTMRRLEHDAAIVFLPEQEFVVCVLVAGMDEVPGELMISHVGDRALEFFTELQEERVMHAGILGTD